MKPEWKAALAALAACIAAILVLYWRTAASMVAIWTRSETFAHGFLIVPIVLALVWAKRREVARLAPAPDALGVALLGGAALAWMLARAGDAQVVQQYAMTAMIPASVVALAGRRVAAALAFPLGFLLFAVPVGEVLLPPLMSWTAGFTIAALRATGIPVYREGLNFVIPSGTWSVVEGCSGLRYLIASVTVGTLYAYLTYRSLWRRALFALLAVAVPVVANGFRAYGIVMIAYLSDMKLALGIDHFIYGWVWFGVVMLALFWIGSFWRESPAALAAEAQTRPARPLSRARLAASAAAIVGLAAAGPLYAAWLERQDPPRAVALPVPGAALGWRRVDSALTAWRPHYQSPAASRFEVYRKDGREVALWLGFYRDQHRGAELVTSANVMIVQKHPVWTNVGEASRRAELDGAATDVRETRLSSARQRLLTWDWFWISGTHLGNPYLAKLYLARDRLLGRGDAGAAIVLATPYGERPEAARDTLREFAADMLPSIDAALARAKEGP